MQKNVDYHVVAENLINQITALKTWTFLRAKEKKVDCGKRRINRGCKEAQDGINSYIARYSLLKESPIVRNHITGKNILIFSNHETVEV